MSLGITAPGIIPTRLVVLDTTNERKLVERVETGWLIGSCYVPAADLKLEFIRSLVRLQCSLSLLI